MPQSVASELFPLLQTQGQEYHLALLSVSIAMSMPIFVSLQKKEDDIFLVLAIGLEWK